jgi:hypothetical protein
VSLFEPLSIVKFPTGSATESVTATDFTRNDPKIAWKIVPVVGSDDMRNRRAGFSSGRSPSDPLDKDSGINRRPNVISTLSSRSQEIISISRKPEDGPELVSVYAGLVEISEQLN